MQTFSILYVVPLIYLFILSSTPHWLDDYNFTQVLKSGNISPTLSSFHIIYSGSDLKNFDFQYIKDSLSIVYKHIVLI